MRKETSTNTLNKTKLEVNCGMAYSMSILGGRWKLSILGFLLEEGTLRYHELKKRLVGISERVLATQLKQLEQDGLIERTVFPEVPPRVEYALSSKGLSLKDLLDGLSEWGDKNRV